MLGIPFAIVSTFVSVFMKDLGANSVLIGFSSATTIALESIVFISGPLLLRRFSLETLYLFGIVCMILRTAGYALITEAWMALPIDLLHGGSFAITWLACVQLFTISVPNEVAATAFAILSMFSWGLGPMVGNLVGGALYHRLGPRWMFWIAGGWTCIILAVFSLHCVVNRNRSGGGDNPLNGEQKTIQSESQRLIPSQTA
jgi:PPP family 3-phenylpropionic acid transporter